MSTPPVSNKNSQALPVEKESLTETATRWRHKAALVATLPAVRRIRNFLNPGSRLPDSTATMYLLGERYERRTVETTPGNNENDSNENENETTSNEPPSVDPGLAAFLIDFQSTAWITYRRNFPAIDTGDSMIIPYTSDAGWGCTYRSGQMLLAQALRIHFFGRAWRRSVHDSLSHDSNYKTHTSHQTLLQWFGDHPESSICPFGIHRVFKWGRGELSCADLNDKKNKNKSNVIPNFVPGKWLGPIIMAQAVAGMVQSSRPGGLCAYVLQEQDGSFGGGAPTLQKEKVVEFAAANAKSENSSDEGDPTQKLDLPHAPFSGATVNDAQSSNEWTPTLLLIPLLLGIDRVINPTYVKSVVDILGIKQSIGILGGTPGASLFLTGTQGDRIFYLDPHTVFPYEEPIVEGAGGGEDDKPSTSNQSETSPRYRCDAVLHLDGKELDPSMVLGFYCRAKSDLDELYVELMLSAQKAGSTPLVTVATSSDSNASKEPTNRVSIESEETGNGATGEDVESSEDDWELV